MVATGKCELTYPAVSRILLTSRLKCTLSVHKKTSNLVCLGDSGRMPLLVSLTKQVKDYFNRIEAIDAANDDTLVRYAFAKQRTLNLVWYNKISKSSAAFGNHGVESIVAVVQFCKQTAHQG